MWEHKIKENCPVVTIRSSAKLLGEGEEIKVVANPKKGYYIKSITRTTRTDEVLVKNDEFTNPYEATEVLFDIVKIEDEKDNLILIPTPIAVDDKIDKDIVEEFSERKLDNSKSELLDAIDKSKLTITDNSKVALSIETSLKSYDIYSKIVKKKINSSFFHIIKW